MTPARDLGYFRQTEAIFNVIRDNETGQLLSKHYSNLDTVKGLITSKELRCHGHNSVKEFLSSTKLNSETGSEVMSPSRFQERLNESSSKWFRPIDTSNYNENN